MVASCGQAGHLTRKICTSGDYSPLVLLVWEHPNTFDLLESYAIFKPLREMLRRRYQYFVRQQHGSS